MDLANISDPSGKVTAVVEMLNETNEILTDMAWREGNLPTGDRTTIRTGLPRPTWRKLYGFVQPSKATTAQVDEQCGMLEAFAEVDCALADLNGNTAAFRLSEDRAHIEGMMQEMADTIFHGDGDGGASFVGLSPRYSSLTGEQNSDHVLNGATAFSSTAATNSDVLNSVWLIVWGPNQIQGIVPKGSMAGLQTNDLGKKLIQGTHDTSSNAEASPGRMMSYVTHYRWDAGISVRDWRYAVRIANVSVNDVTDLTSVAPGHLTLPELMHQAIDTIPNMSSGRAAFYLSRKALTAVRQSVSRLTSESVLSYENVGGTMQTMFAGIPLRRVDALAGDESIVT